tara:strand:- start:696 stop:926 length:231 start_codon:yes stop_codon:yes gene_type:complete
VSEKLDLKIVVKKKDYSLAVRRNKIRRWIKEIFRKSSVCGSFVVVVRRGFLEMGFEAAFTVIEPSLNSLIIDSENK